jgi:uncharacterized membrane protein
MGGVSVIAVAVYGVGGLVCHQRTERSFHLGSTPWPVCARCAGLYLGAVLASWWGVPQWWRLPQSSGRLRGWLAAAATPSVATMIYEWTAGSPPSNLVRAASGVPLGLAVSWLVLAAIDGAGARGVGAGGLGPIRSEYT